MSYKHALALTAFGLGAVLQGCSEDDEKEPCTVNCEDKCKDITDYVSLAKGTTYEEGCGTCIVGRLPSDVKGDTNILKWGTALDDSTKAAATDAQKAVPREALQYCGAKQGTDACAGTTSVDLVNTKAGIDTAVVGLSALSPNCGLCYLLVDVTDCATGKKSLSDCGNAPELECDQDYSCVTIAGAYDDLEVAGTANNVCKTCLDAEIVTDTDITEASYLEAWAASSPDYAALADHLLHCGAEQHVSSCLALSPAAGAWTDAETVLTGASDVCEVCVHMGEFAVVDAPSCREMKTSLATCGSTTAAQNVICPECASFAVDNVNCQTCLTEQLNDGSDWEATALTDLASYAHWAKVAVCGADLAAATSSCSGGLAWADLDDNEVLTFQAAVLDLEPVCNACINTFISGQGTLNCAAFEAARVACSVDAEGSEMAC